MEVGENKIQQNDDVIRIVVRVMFEFDAFPGTPLLSQKLFDYLTNVYFDVYKYI